MYNLEGKAGYVLASFPLLTSFQNHDSISHHQPKMTRKFFIQLTLDTHGFLPPDVFPSTSVPHPVLFWSTFPWHRLCPVEAAWGAFSHPAMTQQCLAGSLLRGKEDAPGLSLHVFPGPEGGPFFQERTQSEHLWCSLPRDPSKFLGLSRGQSQEIHCLRENTSRVYTDFSNKFRMTLSCLISFLSYLYLFSSGLEILIPKDRNIVTDLG